MTKMWVEKPFNLKNAEDLEKETGLTPLTTRLLVSRGIDTLDSARSFLQPNFHKELHNPFSLQGINRFLERVKRAIENQEKVLIHGDYDADGVTTTSIFVESLRELGLEVDYFVPNRFKDGYGVNPKNVDAFSKYDLVITGDTGIKAYEAIYELTTNHNTDVLVTDHHEPYILPIEEKERMPEDVNIVETETQIMALPVCYEVINPKRIDCEYGSEDLSGAGVAFKVMEALYDDMKVPKKNLYNLLDYVVTGLVPDMVPMFNLEKGTFEVRNLVKLGLSIMNNQSKPWVEGIKGLKKRKKPRPITSTDLGFTYGPILNAAGRLYDPTPAVEYLLEKDIDKSLEKVKYLNEVNLERREISNETSKKMVKELKEASSEEVDYGIVVASPDLHEGITGLVAGKILEEYYRTTIAFAELQNEDGNVYYKGSARSIDGISVLQALIDVEKEIGSYVYGGHEQAAGVTIQKDQLVPFKKAFRLACKKQADAYNDDSVFNPKQYYDLEVEFKDVTENFVFELSKFEPFGMKNEEPLFYAKNVEITSLKPIGSEGQYLRFDFKQNGIKIRGVIFSKAKEIMAAYDKALDTYLNVPCEILFFPQINDWDNKVQLLIKDIKIASSDAKSN